MPNPQRIFLTLLLLAGLAMPAAGEERIVNPDRERFDGYWYPNGAEISRFALDQARYANHHPGDAVMVFVTESLNPDTQIKADNAGPSDVPVLKLNAARKFYTGIYPYSTMTSVFTPVREGDALPLKLSLSVQEWCGHVYTQLNRTGSGYRVESHSYFEGEGDRSFDLGAVVPEDALWNRIRTAPADLPVGAFELIPSVLYARFTHTDLTPAVASGGFGTAEGRSLEGGALTRYEVRYRDSGRVLAIDFETAFPHRIQRWEETYAGYGGKVMTTRGERTHTLMVDYWNRHDPPDRRLLDRLGLTDRE